MKLRHVNLSLLLLLFCGWSATEGAEPVQEFTLREHLGHNWRHELVMLPLDAAASAQEALRLVGPDGEEVPCQRVDSALAFIVDLPTDAVQLYRLFAEAPTRATPFEREEKEGRLRTWNSLTGIAVPTTLETALQGPIQGLMMQSGEWVGASQLSLSEEVTAYRLETVASGPVLVELLSTYTLASGATWQLRHRLIAGEPVVRISESWAPVPGGHWRLLLHPELEPDTILWRNSSHQLKPRNGMLARRLDTGKAWKPVTLYPWLAWWEEGAASFVSLFRAGAGITFLAEEEGLKRLVKPQPQAQPRQDPPALDEKQSHSADVLFLAVGQGAAWAEPGQNGMQHALPLRTNGKGETWIDLAFAGPGREWLLGASTYDGTIMPNTELSDAQQSLIRHLETPLQQLLDMTLAWPQDFEAGSFPRLFLDRGDIARVKAFYADQRPEIQDPRQRLLWQALVDEDTKAREEVTAKAMLTPWVFTGHVEHGDPAAGTAIRRPSASAYSHHVTMGLIRNLIWVDAALACGLLDEPQRRKLQARLAFLAYKLGSPDFYDLSRNYRANPNMTTARHAVVGLLGCLLKDHPESKAWNALGEEEIRRQLAEWVGPNGGWLECPHYQTILADALCFLQAAHRIGYSDLALDERLLRTITYLAKISTPPDPRFANRRHFPAAGNTYRFETSMIFSVLAHLHHEVTPQAANDLQWIWQEQGSPMYMAIGGDNVYNTISEFAVARFEPDKPPSWGSDVFPTTGTVMRHGFPGDRESQLYILHGPFDQHYDHDRGALSFWGLGQPLMLDWGYDGRMPADMHSMMGGGNRGKVDAHAFQPHLDYLNLDFGAWRRQILFSKQPSDEAPVMVLVRDTTVAARPLPWNAWFYTEEAIRRAEEGPLLHMVGQADVDLDLWFSGEWREAFPRMTWQEVENEKPPAAPKATLKEADNLAADEAEDFLAGTEPPPPPHLRMRVESVSVVEGYANRHGWNYGGMRQRGLSLTVPPGKPVAWLLYPRLKQSSPPKVTELADGQAVRVETNAGTDLLILATETITFTDGPCRFAGTAGAVKIRGNSLQLTLAAPGSIAWEEHELSSDSPATRTIELR